MLVLVLVLRTCAWSPGLLSRRQPAAIGGHGGGRLGKRVGLGLGHAVLLGVGQAAGGAYLRLGQRVVSQVWTTVAGLVLVHGPGPDEDPFAVDAAVLEPERTQDAGDPHVGGAAGLESEGDGDLGGGPEFDGRMGDE